MDAFTPYVIKSFKHDGHLHRKWLTNWLVPPDVLHPAHQQEEMMVFINSQTKIQESDGKEWVSKIPGVSFFIPKKWFNVVALIEENGIRYYCNVASPPYVAGNVLTYIDYDLDVIRMPGGAVHVVDQEEYELHKACYHYSTLVEERVQEGLACILDLAREGRSPFQDERVMEYYEAWENRKNGGA